MCGGEREEASCRDVVRWWTKEEKKPTERAVRGFVCAAVEYKREGVIVMSDCLDRSLPAACCSARSQRTTLVIPQRRRRPVLRSLLALCLLALLTLLTLLILLEFRSAQGPLLRPPTPATSFLRRHSLCPRRSL
jgi:hypothetical protein